MTGAGPWEALLLAAPAGLPLALAFLVAGGERSARIALRLAPWAALPGLAAAAGASDAVLSLPGVMLGSGLGLDPTGRAFLALTAFLWLTAGVYADGYLARDPARRRFFAFFLLSMAGNLGLCTALDGVTFFAFFTLMSFASYGLVVHERIPENLRAGRVYIVLAVLSEVLVFSGLVLLAAGSGVTFPLAHPETGPLALGLLLAGFAVKVGALPVHVWLPLAHPAAPTPASAVLSGAMIKAGLLGWIRFLPLGAAELPGWGTTVVSIGLLGVFYGVVAGLPQRDPKIVLAYSSISQMGYLTVGVGLGLLAPALWPATLGAIVLYATHHGLAKSALFLGVGAAAASRRLAAAGVLLPALALAGASFTSGASAKAALKAALAAAGTPAGDLAITVLAAAGLGTALLMGRFLVVLLGSAPPAHGLGRSGWGAWALAVLVSATAALWYPGARLDPGLAASGPALAGAVVTLLAWRYRRHLRIGRHVRVPPGDILVLLARWSMPGLRRVLASERRLEMLEGTGAAALVRLGQRLAARARSAERRLNDWQVVGIALLLALTAMMAAALLGL